MIRKATANDFDFIYGLYMHPQINPFLLYEMMDKEFFKPIYHELVSKNLLFVFEKNAEATGMCKLVPQQYRNAHIVYLGGVAIAPQHSGKGLGLQMMHEIIEFAKQKNFLRIELSVASTNKKAIKVYENAGFTKEGLLKNFTYLKSENRFLDEVMMAYIFV